MARNSAGTYTLPTGNPVVSHTTISSTVHNNTNSDIATALTDSLSRSGKGEMTAPLRLADGTVSIPSLTFHTDQNTGLYNPAADTLGITVGGVSIFTSTASQLTYPIQVNITTVNSVDLTNSDAPLVVGTKASTHVEFDADEIQAKSSATVASTLSLNRFGGAVNIGAQSGTGTVTLYNDTDQCLITQENGVAIKDGDGSTPTINFVNSAGTAVGQVVYSSGMYLQSLVNSSPVVLNGYSSGSVQRSVFVGDPNGNSTMYYAGQVGLQSVNTGQIVYSSVNDNPEIGMYQDDKTTRNALIQASTGGLVFYQEVHGAPITLISENNAGTQTTMVMADPDGSASLYYAGLLSMYTANQGIAVQSTTGSSTSVAFYSSAAALEGAIFTQSSGQLIVRAELSNRGVTLQGTDSVNADSTLLDGAPDGALTLYYDNAAKAATTTNGLSVGGSGADVSPTSGGVGQLQFIGSGYTGYVALDGTAMYIGHNSSARTLVLQTDETNRFVINETGLGGFGRAVVASYRLVVQGTSTGSSAYIVGLYDSAGTQVQSVRDDGLFYTGLGTNSPYNLTTASAANMHVTSGGNIARSTSSLKYKKNIESIPDDEALTKIMSLRPVKFKTKQNPNKEVIDSNNRTFAGLIAEEVHAAGLPEFVEYDANGDPDGIMYSHLVALAFGGIKQLVAQNNELRARIEALEAPETP